VISSDVKEAAVSATLPQTSEVFETSEVWIDTFDAWAKVSWSSPDICLVPFVSKNQNAVPGFATAGRVATAGFRLERQVVQAALGQFDPLGQNLPFWHLFDSISRGK
jgi:hypothetical protein